MVEEVLLMVAPLLRLLDDVRLLTITVPLELIYQAG